MGLLDFLFSIPNDSVHYSSSKDTYEKEQARAAYRNEEKDDRSALNDLRVGDIESHIHLKKMPTESELEVFCPVCKSKIYPHSILIDKLGDLTKFIIKSLYFGKTLEEISALTQMGDLTINEEISFLVKGGLVTNDGKFLTKLGKQYGELIDIFDILSEGIDVTFNLFADRFEFGEVSFEESVDSELILDEHFIPTLARNDNYANSLNIALEYIKPDLPFCNEIKSSLYTTVYVDRNTSGYIRKYIRDFLTGENYPPKDPYVVVAMPVERIYFKPRYKWIDSYRDVIGAIKQLKEKHCGLLSEEAIRVCLAETEEEETGIVVKTINTVTGMIDDNIEVMSELPEEERIFVFDKESSELEIECENIYIEEVSRESLYHISYYPYSHLEE